MAQPKKHASNAAKQKAYRQRHKDGKRTRKLAAFPVVQLGDCTLYQGDARLILPTLMGIDVVLTDPQYSATTHAGDAALIVGDTGLVVSIRNPVALADAWLNLIQLGPAGRKKLGERSRQRIREHFNLADVNRRYQGLYRQVINQTFVPQAPLST